MSTLPAPSPTLTQTQPDRKPGPAVRGRASWPFLSPAGLVFVGLLALGFVGVFWRWFLKQHQHSWHAPNDWGHSYLIPFISAYLIYLKRDQLAALKARTFWPGLAALAFGIAAYFFCVVGLKNHMLQGLSMIVALYGLILLLLGPAMSRVLFLPIAYLAFAITISERVMLIVTFQLQLLASVGGGILLQLLGPVLGFRVEVEGNTLTLFTKGSGTPIPLNVAEACSGMRMVIAFIALGAAVALVSCRHWWQRIALILLATPVAVLMNVLRVAVLAVLAVKVDQGLAGGKAHEVIGMLLLVPGLFLFMGVVWALNRVVADEPAPVAGKAHFAFEIDWSIFRRPAILVALGVLITCGAGMSVAIHQARINLVKLPINPPGNRQLSTLPRETPTWKQLGTDHLESPEIVETLGTPNYVSRKYLRKNPDKDAPPIVIEFHAAYYTGMIDTVPHVPERCMIGGGWQQGSRTEMVPLKLDTSNWRLMEGQLVPPTLAGKVKDVRVPNWSEGAGSRVSLPLGIESADLRTTEFILSSNGRKNRVYAGYFFIANGGTVSSAEGVRLLAFDLRNDYAYYLKVQVSSSTVNSATELGQYGAELINELLPSLMRCVPDWVEVEAGRYPESSKRLAVQEPSS